MHEGPLADEPGAYIPPDLSDRLDTHGYVILPGYLRAEEMAPALAELTGLFPTAEEFHDPDRDPDDPRFARFHGNQFAGIDKLPFKSVEWSLLAVHDRIIDLAEASLGADDLRLYAAEAWGKYTGAADYDQSHHRDFIDHTPLVPTADPRYGLLEMFLYFDGLSDDLGATRVVPSGHSADVPIWPYVCTRDDQPQVYEHEVAVTGPPGTVLVYRPSTLHRGTQLTRPASARFTLHMNYRTAEAAWANRLGWGEESIKPTWHPFINRASFRQVLLFGFPRPGHPYWTTETIDGVGSRYSGLDMTPWRNALEAD